MLPLSILKNVVERQYENFLKKDTGIPREINFKKYLKTGNITVISGVRRCGKSTLLAQFSRKLNDFYYLNLDDEQLIGFDVKDFSQVLGIYQKMFPSKNILLDEVHQAEYWERFVRRIHDEGYKVFVTGSNSRLMDSSLSVHLTGRYLQLGLFPFSFSEMLILKPKKYQKVHDPFVLFDKYLREGGFPEFLIHEEKEILKRIYEDILYRDIIALKGLKGIKTYREIARLLFTDFCKEFSYHSLSKNLAVKSITSVKNFLSYLKEAYLVFELYKYDYSLRKQYTSNKKAYIIDNGLRNAVAFQFSEDNGRLLENCVFLELKRRQLEFYYYKGRKECDFITVTKGKTDIAIQVCWQLSGAKEREIDGLREVGNILKPKSYIILTYEEEDRIRMNNKIVQVIPVYKWIENYCKTNFLL